MTKTQKISIFLTLLLLFASIFFDTRTTTSIAFLLILSLGILHGANDIQIIRKVQSNTHSFIKVLLQYVLVVLGAGLLFFAIPKVGLALFLLISGYHFGEQHFHSTGSKYPRLNIAFFAAYGLGIIFMLLHSSAELSSEVIYDITALKISAFHFLLIGLIFLALALLMGLFLVANDQIKYWFKELVFLFLFYLIFKYSSLIFGFALYFVIWHSLPSLLDQVKFLSGQINRKNIWHYIKESAMYWVMAVLGLSVFVFFLRENEQLFLSLFFTFLAAITFPHVIVMHHLFKSNSEDSQK